MEKKFTWCNACGSKIPEGLTCGDLYSQLAFYTLAHQDRTFFIHQLVVDAHGASHIDEQSKPVAVCATLLGLWLFNEHGYTGKQVQDIHMELGNAMKEFSLLDVPNEKADITIFDVLEVKEGDARDEKIKEWSRAVWQLWKAKYPDIVSMLVEIYQPT
jgi:hypothetical protein